MLEAPQITHITAQPTAIIHILVPREEIQSVMGPTIQELFSTIATQGIAPAGHWFTHHLRRPTESFDFEVSVPVTKRVSPAGRVKPSTWPDMKVARTVYQGPYEGLAGAWGEFLAWIEANGHQRAEDLWERYLVGPDSSPDPATWRTELIQPLVN